MTEEEPRLSARELIERLEPALSWRGRVRAMVALVAGVCGTVLVTALWWTEPGPLPGRSLAVFALLTAFCLTWAGYGAWSLTRRVPLFAADRVLAAWIALTASVATTATTAVIAAQRGTGPGYVLAGGGLFVAAALWLTVRAHARRAELLRRKRELLDGSTGTDPTGTDPTG